MTEQNVPDEFKSDKDTTELKETPILFLKGFFMGSADVVPGVSGGTIALIMGIYYRFMNAIRSVDANVIKALLTFRIKDVFEQVHWKFLMTLLFGILCAVIFFTRVIPLPELMITQPELIYGLFFGLILGSVFLLVWGLEAKNLKVFLWILLGTLIGYKVVTLVPVETPDNMFFIFFSGSIAISAMVLPGISGSFILLILRKYDTVLGAFGKLGGSETLDALMVLVPFGLGMLLGIAVFARLLTWLLKRYYVSTLCILIGFMAGSLFIIWPFQEQEYVESYRTEIVAVNSEYAQEILRTTPDTDALEYVKPGNILNPDEAPEFQKMEIITVKKKTISSEPYIPDWQGNDARLTNGQTSVIQGYSMMLAGMILVIFIGYVSYRKTDKQGDGSIV
jgi:putative membrane protein